MSRPYQCAPVSHDVDAGGEWANQSYWQNRSRLRDTPRWSALARGLTPLDHGSPQILGNVASLDEVKAMAELVLNNLASAIIHSAVFPQYPVRGVEETIRFHLRPPRKRTFWLRPALRDFLVESFDRFQLAGLALICLKNEIKADFARSWILFFATCAT